MRQIRRSGLRRTCTVLVVTLGGLVRVVPVLAQEPAPNAASPISSSAALPANLSLPVMFLHADIVVQSVMVGLGLASVVTWTVLAAKGITLFTASRRLSAALRVAEVEPSLAALQNRLADARGPAALMLAAIAAEQDYPGGTPQTPVSDRITSRLRRLEMRLARQMTRGTGLLATIGATAPFIGLFGTVWGIMNSFIGISKTQTTNLAVVAPGIAEALMATAAGLIAAIPAVVIYNLFARTIGGYRHGLGELATTLERLASRELDVTARQLRVVAE